MKTAFTSRNNRSHELDAKWAQWRENPSDGLMEDMLKDLSPTLSSALVSFGGNDPTLKPRTLIIASQAIRNFNPSEGASLSTHVYNRLKSLYRVRADRASTIHVPENVKLDSHHLFKFRQEFLEKNRREPTIEEMMDETGFSKKRLGKALGFGNELSTSQMQSDKGDINILSGQQDPWVDYVYHDVDPTNQKIMEDVMGYGGSPRKPKHQVAAELGISAPAVSQRISSILAKLKQRQIKSP